MRRLGLLFLSVISANAAAKLTVAATTTDLSALTKEVGGDQVDVFAVAKGTQDPHQIEAKPSFMVRFRDADLVVSQGLDLEAAWLTPLITGSRNTKIKPNTSGNLELGPSLDPLEVNKDATRAEGDVHPAGNPHFQLDPVRMGTAAIVIGKRLGELQSNDSAKFSERALGIQRDLKSKTEKWQERIRRTGIKEVVTYHKTFSYFLNRFAIENHLQLEPKPGIPPTASHIIDVIKQMKARGIRLVLIENYFDDSIRKKLESELPDVKVRVVPVSVEGLPHIKSTSDLIENLVITFEEAAK